MWLAECGRRREGQGNAAQVGRVTLPGDPAGVYVDAERRELPVFGPGGYVWRPAQGSQVLVLKTGMQGEAPCVAGERCRQEDLLEGEVLIHSGAASIRLGQDGVIRLSGNVLVNGKPVMTMEG